LLFQNHSGIVERDGQDRILETFYSAAQ